MVNGNSAQSFMLSSGWLGRHRRLLVATFAFLIRRLLAAVPAAAAELISPQCGTVSLAFDGGVTIGFGRRFLLLIALVKLVK